MLPIIRSSWLKSRAFPITPTEFDNGSADGARSLVLNPSQETFPARLPLNVFSRNAWHSRRML